jgi:hypothetical protein
MANAPSFHQERSAIAPVPADIARAQRQTAFFRTSYVSVSGTTAHEGREVSEMWWQNFIAAPASSDPVHDQNTLQHRHELRILLRNLRKQRHRRAEFMLSTGPKISSSVRPST